MMIQIIIFLWHSFTIIGAVRMEKAFERYVKVEIIALGVLLFVRAILAIDYIFTEPEESAINDWEFYGDFRFLKAVYIPIEVLYILGVPILFFGMHRRDERFFYVLIAAGSVDFGAMVLREITMYWRNSTSYGQVTWLLSHAVLAISYELIHCIMTIIALSRLYTKERHARKQFVRFRVKDEDEAGGLIINSDDRRD
ncbi:uncharacterized protein LOC129755975 isoform X1 [Uranotaenia lowii]|uniref:uncharacterized protein LOC129755975 isoform X1 n=1 Tax=Uranotaenia lowii TaxID=190385 RepID=UPI002479D41F|nr:uncharacterized protein LOC129755975 isoform X1 [Uranotaenia lowii]